MLSVTTAYVQYRVPELKVGLIHRALVELQSSRVQDVEAAECSRAPFMMSGSKGWCVEDNGYGAIGHYRSQTEI